MSRQTLHNVEREGLTDLWPTTFAALDHGLNWPDGTARELARGNREAIQKVLSVDDRVSYVRNEMLGKVAKMSLEDLETLVQLWESHVLGTPARGATEHLELMEQRLRELESRIMNAEHGGSSGKRKATG